jgi:WD40-like Beta Propeller Repeat
MVLLLSLTQLGPAAHAATCTLNPVLQDFTINQGVGSSSQPAANYSPLTRGKETEVRLYLSKPSCATNGQAIGLTSATLTMRISGSTAKTYTPLLRVSSTSPAPLVNYSSAPAPDSTGDPEFVIPGPDLVSSTPTSRFTASFSATINCSTCATPLTFSSAAGRTMSTTVEQRTRALRVLVVPMGATLTSTDNATLQAGLNNLSRMLPVPKVGGQLTGPLSSTSTVGGIRYAVNNGVASVPLTNGKYCGNLNNFTTIKGELAQYRNDWNAANSANTTNPDANPTADVVLGVISSAISLGGDSGCAEGMASVSSPEAWVRLVPATTTPSTAGSLMAMEIAHTFGAEGSWADPFSPTHSANTEADAGTNRAYNITTRSFLADDRSAMKSSGTGWNQDTTVYEKRDFNFLLCRLGGQPNTDCLTTGTVGTINGVAAGPTFVMSGTTDNTSQGTHVVESFSNQNIAFTDRPASSPYTLKFLHGSTVASQIPVAVRFNESDHIPNQDPDQIDPIGLFTVAVPFPLNADPNNLELDYQPPTGSPVVLFSSAKNGQPTLRNLSVSSGSFVNYTNTSNADEFDPALAQDGKWIAWIDNADGPTLEVGSSSDINNTSSYFPMGAGASHPAWNPQGTMIAFAGTDGSIYTVPVDTSGSSPVFGSEKKVYDGSNYYSPAGDNPTFSPDGSQIAFEANGDILTVNTDGSNLSALTFSGGEGSGIYSDPSWSQTSGDNRIAFTGPDGIYTLDPSSEGGPQLLINGAYQPSWGTDGIIAYNNDGTIHTFDTAQTFASSAGPPAIDGQAGEYPAYVHRGISAFVRSFPTGSEGSQRDVMLERPGVSIAATGGIDGGNTDQQSLNNLRLTLYYQCPGVPERSVLGLALQPTSFANVGTPQATANFNQTFEETELCGGQGGGTVTGIMSDFFSSAPFPGQAGFDPVIQNASIDNSSQAPVAAIVDPVDGTTYFDWENIALQGEGSDASLRQLPDANLTWTVSGPNLPQSRTATGSTVDLGALPAGDYTVTLVATDPATGASDQTTRRIHVIADTDRDGLSNAFESSQLCFPAGSATDGNSINLDSDNDGIPDGQDPNPCDPAASYSPSVTFDPSTLYVPSNGNFVTMYVAQNHGTPNLASVTAGSVRITSISGVPIGGSTPVTFQVSDQPFSINKSWTISGTVGKDQKGTAKFDRQALNSYISRTFKLNQKLTVSIGGYSAVPSWTFAGSATPTVKKG